MTRILLLLIAIPATMWSGAVLNKAPRIWNDDALSRWATPVAGLNLAPSHYSAGEYYASPEDNYRTYPVYHPDREPAGYWEWLHAQKPAPLVEAAAIETTADWIAAGRRAFEDLDFALIRTDDPTLIAQARDPRNFAGVFTYADGSVVGPRWVVTPAGVKLGVRACAACHGQRRPGGERDFVGPPGGRESESLPVAVPGMPLVGAAGTAWRLQHTFPGDPRPVALWREFTVPWAPDPRIERFRTMTAAETQQLASQQLLGRSFGGGVFARTGGSPFAPTKIPDLQILRYSRYLDATATHRLDGPEDIARYAALVTGADRMEYGTHRIRSESQGGVRAHYADEVLYAIGMYLMSLEPPRNPSPASPDLIERGAGVFSRSGCATCHAPPAYTTGKLTLAAGYTPPADHPLRADIMTSSAGTDPDTALKTRKGTGLYKIPSLRGVWYRPRLLHDGSITSLEEFFDPTRLEAGYQGTGWRPPGVTARAVIGHPFGLRLTAAEKAALLAFLRSL